MEVVASKLAVANNFPEGDQAHDRTVLVCVSSRTACSHPIINHKILPTQESTKLTQLPNQTRPKYSSIGSNFIWLAKDEEEETLQWQRRVEGVCSQIRTVLSPLQEAKTGEVPVAGFQAKLQTLSVCPSSVWISFSIILPSSYKSMLKWLVYLNLRYVVRKIFSSKK
jgi:hypothetical protein